MHKTNNFPPSAIDIVYSTPLFEKKSLTVMSKALKENFSI